MLLEKLNVRIELENKSEIARFKAMGYEEVIEEKPKSKKGKGKPPAGDSGKEEDGGKNGEDDAGSKE